MSKFDYQQSRELAMGDPTFAALIMAAYRKADNQNAARLKVMFPSICEEMMARYHAPDGLLEGEK